MPLRSSRWPLAGMAACLAGVFVALAGSPAFASQVRGQEWWLRELHVTQAWQASSGSGVTVALLSTGVDVRQPDLTGSVTTGPDYTRSGRTPGGSYWGIEGTALASLLVGHGHGPGHADGIMGVAPSARVLSVRVTPESDDPLLANPAIAGRLPGAIADGIKYAVAHGATVVDLPLDPVTTPGAAGAGGSKAERAAVAYALAHGVVLVAPAGDGGAGADAVNYPAAYKGVISVGAFDSNFVKAPFSSHQPYVTLTAAGEGVVAAAVPNGYTTLNSTSAASAVVAGIVALIRARFPALAPGQVRKALIRSTVFRPAGGRADGSGYGTVDAARALAEAARVSGSVAASRATASPGPRSPPASPASLATRATSGTTGSTASTLLDAAGLAVAVLAVLAIVVLGIGWLWRRRARDARLAGVRAAVEVLPRRPQTHPGAPLAEPPPAPATGLAGVLGRAGAPSLRLPGAAPADPPARPPGEPATGVPAEVAPFLPAPHGGAATGGAGSDRSPFPASPFPPDSSAAAPDLAVPGPGTGRPADSTPRITQRGAGAGTHGRRHAGNPGRPSPLVRRPVTRADRAHGSGAAEPGETGPGDPVRGDPLQGNAGQGNAGQGNAGQGDTGHGPDGTGTAAGTGAGRGAGQGPYRMGVIHRPTVSGSPPWGPAPRPDSDPLWAPARDPEASPSQGTAPPLPQRRPHAADGASAWDRIAAEAWPGGPRRATAPRTAGAGTVDTGTAGVPGSGVPGTADGGLAASRDPGTATEGRAGQIASHEAPEPGTPGGPGAPAGRQNPWLPLAPGRPRAWNPGASTETIPSVGSGEPGGP